MRASGWLVPSILGVVACNPGLIEGDKGSTGDDPEDTAIENIGGDSGDGGEESNLGTITGTVSVALYEEDDDGEITSVDWEEAYGDDFPFGSIFVAAFTLDPETNVSTFYDQYVVRSPDVEGNSYTLEVDPEVVDEVWVYAVLDYWGDGILSVDEPSGIYDDVVPIMANTVVDDVDIEILAPYYDFGDGSGSGGGDGPDGVGGGGGGDGSSSPYVTISGDALITEEYAGGSCVSLLYDSSGGGPYFAKSFTPSKTDTGAEGTYALKVSPDYGASMLIGAWDRNYNGLFDPSDAWGSWVDETGSLMNPLTVGSEDLPDHTLMIPDGSSASVSVVPFVVLSGTVSYEGGLEEFSGGSIWLAELKYRPTTDVTVTDVIANSYDYVEITGADLTGDTASFSMVAPANTILYLWAYTDGDGDGVLNEVDTPVASYGDETGRLTTGTSSVTGIELVLQSEAD